MNKPAAINAQAYYGTPVTGLRLSAVEGAHIVPGGVPYDDGRTGRCRYGEDTCQGFAIQGSDFCVGHTKRVQKAVKTKTGVE